MFNLDIFAKSRGDGMIAVDYPEALDLASLAPLERTGCSHQLAEDFGEMAGVQNDQPHAFPDAFLHALNNGVAHLAMDLVAPPEQYIGALQTHFGQAMLGHVLGRDFE